MESRVRLRFNNEMLGVEMSFRKLMVVTALAACGTFFEAEGEVIDTQTPAQVVVESVGGIAGIRLRLRLDSSSATVTRQTCRAGLLEAECVALGQRDTITISRAEVKRIFGLTVTAEFRALRADYGNTSQGADLFDHTVSITANSRTRRIHADDVTRPDLLAALIDELARTFP